MKWISLLHDKFPTEYQASLNRMRADAKAFGNTSLHAYEGNTCEASGDLDREYQAAVNPDAEYQTYRHVDNIRSCDTPEFNSSWLIPNQAVGGYSGARSRIDTGEYLDHLR